MNALGKLEQGPPNFDNTAATVGITAAELESALQGEARANK